MPFTASDTGIQIQSLQEIIDEWNASLRGLFGVNFKLDNGSVAEKVVGIASEREALYQQLVQTLVDLFDPNNATGVLLEILAGITNTQKQGATFSKSSDFLATGTPATAIVNGRQFELAATSEVWEIVDGPFVIGGGGTIAVTAQAVESGPTVFQTSPPGDWNILLGVAGWDDIEATADIDPEDIGNDIESDEELRERRKDELLINGNDLEAIRAAVLKVSGVTFVRTFENTSCIVAVDGIPPGAFEVMVDGGSDAAIAAAIQSRRPPGAQAFGTTITNITTSEGDILPIGHTRPADIDMWILITADTTSAEGDLPANAEQTILDTVLAEANKRFNNPGVDPIPQALEGVVFSSTRDAQGRDSFSSVTILMSTDNGPGVAPAFPPGFPAPGGGADPYVGTPKPITIRERADFDSTRIGVTIL